LISQFFSYFSIISSWFTANAMPKRKLSVIESVDEELSKRPKLTPLQQIPSDRLWLPELWDQIIAYVDFFTMVRLLRVCQSFYLQYHYLPRSGPINQALIARNRLQLGIKFLFGQVIRVCVRKHIRLEAVLPRRLCDRSTGYPMEFYQLEWVSWNPWMTVVKTLIPHFQEWGSKWERALMLYIKPKASAEDEWKIFRDVTYPLYSDGDGDDADDSDGTGNPDDPFVFDEE